MRLINTHEFPPKVPKDIISDRKYAILSHTWGDDEVTLSDLREPEQDYDSPSWRKIRGAQEQAVKGGFDWIWIDTLCIDKSSSAELSEAINSMYKWYQDAEVCYVYLSDMPGCLPFGYWHPEDSQPAERFEERLRACRWFKRGWTLQELIAPKSVQFYDKHWSIIASLSDSAGASTHNGFARTLSNITAIHLPVLENLSQDLTLRYSIAQRMSWASFRQTTRPEDRAYSLLGILDLSLDIRYGEGYRAFQRLQEELIATSNDESILAWDEQYDAGNVPGWALTNRNTTAGSLQLLPPSQLYTSSLLASSPDEFADAHDIISSTWRTQLSRMANVGLQTTARILNEQQHDHQMILNCVYLGDPTIAIGVHIEKTGELAGDTAFYKVMLRPLSKQTTIRSRLAHIDALEAMRAHILHDIVVKRFSTTTVPRLPPRTQRRTGFTVWLRLANQLDRTEFLLEQSQPVASCQHGNPIWRVPDVYYPATSAPVPTFEITVRHDSGSRIFLCLGLRRGFNFMDDLNAPNDDIRKATQMNLMSDDWTDATLSPATTYISIDPGLHIATAIQMMRLSGSETYVVQMWSSTSKQLLMDSIREFCLHESVDTSPTPNRRAMARLDISVSRISTAI